MKKEFYIIVCLFSISINVFSQLKKNNPFLFVKVPDSIVTKLDSAYGNAQVNAGRNVYNLINRKDFEFNDGIYSFQGQGPHFPRRIFIYNNGKFYSFQNAGAFNQKGVLIEFLTAIEVLKLTEKQIVLYLDVIAKYLTQEYGQTYGSEVKQE